MNEVTTLLGEVREFASAVQERAQGEAKLDKCTILLNKLDSLENKSDKIVCIGAILSLLPELFELDVKVRMKDN